MQKPTLGRIVHYRGKQGYQAARAAIVTATEETLDPRGVEAGHVPALTDDTHVHLWVYSPGDSGGFAEYNVAPGRPDDPLTQATAANIPPGTWCWPPRI
ncbi:hypothetical protein GCM10010124_26300 [Pilimelia terevasa]|uniref:Uncharacterized protein n=1 Tax=Pilimelia terevasa TaxID=53372 RepID=A0A8J3FK97_9ACTN|nr:hypothetical protein [Pilimelia terevasa]GGK32268.1 hypothetical protein GCM10010124_26300 [Pilimelia terevasa]